jgi:hypothetical protein
MMMRRRPVRLTKDYGEERRKFYRREAKKLERTLCLRVKEEMKKLADFMEEHLFGLEPPDMLGRPEWLSVELMLLYGMGFLRHTDVADGLA